MESVRAERLSRRRAVARGDAIDIHASQRDGEHMESFVGSFDVRSADRADVSDGALGRGAGGAARALGYGRGRGASREDSVRHAMETRNTAGQGRFTRD